jgi:hypothetical protein
MTTKIQLPVLTAKLAAVVGFEVVGGSDGTSSRSL